MVQQNWNMSGSRYDFGGTNKLESFYAGNDHSPACELIL